MPKIVSESAPLILGSLWSVVLRYVDDKALLIIFNFSVILAFETTNSINAQTCYKFVLIRKNQTCFS